MTTIKHDTTQKSTVFYPIFLYVLYQSTGLIIWNVGVRESNHHL